MAVVLPDVVDDDEEMRAFAYLVGAGVPTCTTVTEASVGIKDSVYAGLSHAVVNARYSLLVAHFRVSGEPACSTYSHLNHTLWR